MPFSRRDFLKLLAASGVAGFACTRRERDTDLYDIPPFGNVSLLHFSDSHGQLLPLYLREPSWHSGSGEQRIKAEDVLKNAHIAPGSAAAHALTPADFVTLAQQYGKVGGYAYLATLVKSLRDQRGDRALLLNGGSGTNGSATALWTEGADMAEAHRLLGVDLMTGNGEFLLGAEQLKTLLGDNTRPQLLAANIEDIVWGTHPFKAAAMRELGGVRVATIGIAYPHFSEAHPQNLCPDWRFTFDEAQIQQRVDEVRDKAELVVLLSHIGLPADLKLASRLHGVDVILSGHSHDALPSPFVINNASGRTLVICSGSHGKFISVLDLQVRKGKLRDYRYRLVPIFSDRIAPDTRMTAHIEKIRAPFREKLAEPLARSESLLYRRDPFMGTMDQVLVQAMRTMLDVEIAFTPGYRWGQSLLPGETITHEAVMSHTAIPNPECQAGERTGEEIKNLLEHFADLTFNKDPYSQYGYDMVRTGGLYYRINPAADSGQRIAQLSLADGRPIEADKIYKVASWGVGEPHDGPAIWDVVGDYLRKQQTIKVEPSPSPIASPMA